MFQREACLFSPGPMSPSLYETGEHRELTLTLNLTLILTLNLTLNLTLFCKAGNIGPGDSLGPFESYDSVHVALSSRCQRLDSV